MTRSRDVADTQKNIGGSVPPFAAGKNKIINGDFGIWQRGTSFSTNASYTADRWYTDNGGTFTVSRQTFTPGAAPVAGYEGKYFYRLAKTSTTAGGIAITTLLEDVQTFAGQTVTLSYWAKADATMTNEPYYAQEFGSGGSARAGNALSTHSITTSWVRYSQTFSIPSISGKTIGTGSYLLLYPIRTTDSAQHTVDLWGVQLEAGSAVTPFQTATGTIQGELAACQRYYWRIGGGQIYESLAVGLGKNGNTVQFTIPNPTSMRTKASTVDYSSMACYDGVTVSPSITTLTINSTQSSAVQTNLEATITGSATQYRPYFLLTNNSTSAYFGLGAEL